MEDFDRYKDLLDNLYDGVYFVDLNRSILYWNKAAEEMTGFSKEEVLGRRCMDNILRHIDSNGTELCEVACPLVETITRGCSKTAEVYLHHKEGHRVPVYVRITPVRDNNGNIIGGLELFSNNSSKVAIIEKLVDMEKLALLDPLTKVGNRRYVEMQLNNMVHEFSRYGNRFGMLMMDIDNFKEFNDLYGHDIGDRVLVMVANNIINNSRASDVFGRWGGEEFIAIYRNADDKGLKAKADQLRILVKKSFLLAADQRLQVTMSLGGTLARKEDSLESLVKRADEQMYRSKHEGRDRVSIDAR